MRTRALPWVTAATLRPLTELIPLTPPGIRLSRRIVAGSLARFGPPLRGSLIEPVAEPRGEWVRGPSAADGGTVLLYLHGSGYMLCSARTHRGLTTRLSDLTGLPVFSSDYRLAPEHRFPAAADDVRAAYDWLAGRGYRRIIVAGDSAGGHLAVDLALQLGREGLPGPAALVLFSPLVDTTFGLARERERVRRDPMISVRRARRLVGLYTRDAEPGSPRLAFALDAADRLPPTLIQAGGAEMLRADAVHLAGLYETAGAPCELEIWPGQMHVFQALPLLVPEAGAALRRAAAFVRTHAGQALEEAS